MSTCLSWDCISKNPLLLYASKLSLPQAKSVHDLEGIVKISPFSPKAIAAGYKKTQAQKCWQIPACPQSPCSTYSSSSQQPVLLMGPQDPCHTHRQQTTAALHPCPAPSAGETSLPRSFCKFLSVHPHQRFRGLRD